MADDSPAVFRVEGREYPVPEQYTIGEMCDMEQFFGVEFGDDTQGTGMRMAAAVLWLAIKRVDPSITVEEIRAMPPEVFADIAKADARPPAPNASSESAASSGEDTEDTPAPPGQRPESYWQPSLGHWFGLRPSDIGTITPGQLLACFEFMDQATKK